MEQRGGLGKLPKQLRLLRSRQKAASRHAWSSSHGPLSFLQVQQSVRQGPRPIPYSRDLQPAAAPKLPTKVTENSPFLAADLWKYNIGQTLCGPRCLC